MRDNDEQEDVVNTLDICGHFGDFVAFRPVSGPMPHASLHSTSR